MDIATLVEAVKGRKGWTDTNKDVRLYEIAPDHLEFAKDYTNNDFLVDGVERIPRPVINFVADACEMEFNAVKGLESRRLGDVSFNYETDYPESMLRKLRKYRKVSF